MSATGEAFFTLARWDVLPGKEAEFIEAWSALSAVFAGLARPPLWGTLVRSDSEPSVFYSFGPWRDKSDIDAMRADPRAQAGFAALSTLCSRMAPGRYETVRHVDVPARGS